MPSAPSRDFDQGDDSCIGCGFLESLGSVTLIMERNLVKLTGPWLLSCITKLSFVYPLPLLLQLEGMLH